MKKKFLTLAICALGTAMVFALAGCGANLDRDVTIQNMSLSVPSNWEEKPSDSNSDTSGNI